MKNEFELVLRDYRAFLEECCDKETTDRLAKEALDVFKKLQPPIQKILIEFTEDWKIDDYVKFASIIEFLRFFARRM